MTGPFENNVPEARDVDILDRLPVTGAALYSHNPAATDPDKRLPPVGQHNPLPISDARPPATDCLYAASGTGAAVSLATNAYMAELTAVGGDVWFRFGTGTVTASTPTTAVTTGASRYLPQGASILVDTRNITHYAVSGGSYSLAWWVA